MSPASRKLGVIFEISFTQHLFFLGLLCFILFCVALRCLTLHAVGLLCLMFLAFLLHYLALLGVA